MDQPITRPLFTDGVNSLAHFGFGVLAATKPIDIPIFLYYQLYISKGNAPIDITEFALGWLFKEMNKK